MPRKPRIEYANAFYHVMNRGRGRQLVFHGEKYYQAFIEILKDVHERFGCIIHGYCLMGNHYHLLLETPQANLSRIMRHINGVYTQHHNRMKKTDGSLFRGRFKSILVDQDAYIMQLSRYIHRNPIDMKRPMVEKLIDYKWSSYRAYINKERTPDWLHRDFVYDALGFRNRYKAYENYVNQGVDDETATFFAGDNPAVIGDSVFKEWIFDKLSSVADPEQKSRIVATNVTIKLVIDVVVKYYDVTIAEVIEINKRPQKENEARKVAMYLSQELTNSFLNDIAPYFNLKNTGSVSHATYQVRNKKRQNKGFERKIGKIIKEIVREVACSSFNY